MCNKLTSTPLNDALIELLWDNPDQIITRQMRRATLIMVAEIL